MMNKERPLAYFSAFAAVLTLLSLAACSSYQEKEAKGLPGSSGNGTVSYQTVHEKVFAPNCLACHGNSGGVNLESYASVKRNLKMIEKVVFKTKTMPKGKTLGSTESELLLSWIKAGAPEIVSGDTPGSGGGLHPTFASIKTKIFIPKCLACHTVGGPAAGVPLENEKELLESPRDLVVAGDPAQSGLYIAITRQDSKRMPPPSSGASALSTEEIIAIKQWIETGVAGTTPPIDEARLSYEAVRRKVFKPSCVSCHGTSGGVNLESYEEVKKHLSAIGQAVLVKEIMPKNGTLSMKQRELLATWILAGGPRFPGEAPQPSNPPPVNGNPSELSFQNVKNRIFAPRCISCHGTSGGISLETYASVKDHLAKIAVAALVSKFMPPTGPLPKEDADLLTAWFKAGAPEGIVLPPSPAPSPTVAPSPIPSPVISPPPNLEPTEPTYASIRKSVFEVRCIVCHKTGGPAAGVPLMPWKELMASPRELVLPGNPDESGLLIAVSRQDSKRMPPPSTGDALPAAVLKAIRDWIVAGAKE
jgi:mono/diheme cytochrome c family protein